MRRATVMLVLGLLLLAAPATMAKSTLMINPLAALSKRIVVEFETGVAGWSRATTLGVIGSFRDGGVDLGAGVRYYMDGVAHDGLYFGGYGVLSGLQSTGNTGTASGAIGITGVAGYKWQLDNGLVLDAGASVGIASSAHSGINFGVGLAF